MTQSPLDTITSLTVEINRGDLEAMLNLFEPNAVLIVQAQAGQPGQILRGTGAIRDAYKGFLAMKPTLVREAQQIVESDGIALHYSKWALKATSPDGKKVENIGVSTDVLRRQADGRWLVLIYNPYGTSVLG